MLLIEWCFRCPSYFLVEPPRPTFYTRTHHEPTWNVLSADRFLFLTPLFSWLVWWTRLAVLFSGHRPTHETWIILALYLVYLSRRHLTKVEHNKYIKLNYWVRRQRPCWADSIDFPESKELKVLNLCQRSQSPRPQGTQDITGLHRLWLGRTCPVIKPP